MKRLTTFLAIFLFAFALQGQTVLTYQGGTSLMDAGKGTFDSGTESWAALGTNTIENDDGALKITYDSNMEGAYIQLRSIRDIDRDLTVGKIYKVRARAKINAGAANLAVYTSGFNLSSALTTNYEWHEIIFTATSTNANSLKLRNFGATEIVWIDEWYIQEWYPDGRVLMYDGKVLIYE